MFLRHIAKKSQLEVKFSFKLLLDEVLEKKLIRDGSTQPVGSFARMVTKLQRSQNLNTVFVFHAARVGVGYGIGVRAEFFFHLLSNPFYSKLFFCVRLKLKFITVFILIENAISRSKLIFFCRSR